MNLSWEEEGTMSEEQQIPDPQVNAFSPAFLERLQEIDDVGTAQETEFSGPWKIVATEGGYALLRVYEEIREGRQPEALFADLPSALCFFAVLPSVGRSPRIELDSSRSAGWHGLSRAGSPVGRILKRVLKPADARASWLSAEEFPPR
jgi:hypothetical protein